MGNWSRDTEALGPIQGHGVTRTQETKTGSRGPGPRNWKQDKYVEGPGQRHRRLRPGQGHWDHAVGDRDMDTGDNGRDMKDWERDMRDMGALGLGEVHGRTGTQIQGNRAGM